MEIPEPKKGEITVYSKSGCFGCNCVKKFLKEKKINHSIIDCDEFLLDDKEYFLQFIQKIVGKERKHFPIVFDGKIFVGGLDETVSYLDKLLDFDLSF
jgi:glutaredoxin